MWRMTCFVNSSVRDGCNRDNFLPSSSTVVSNSSQHRLQCSNTNAPNEVYFYGSCRGGASWGYRQDERCAVGSFSFVDMPVLRVLVAAVALQCQLDGMKWYTTRPRILISSNGKILYPLPTSGVLKGWATAESCLRRECKNFENVGLEKLSA